MVFFLLRSRCLLFFFVCVVVLVSGKSIKNKEQESKEREIHPTKVGFYHTEAFRNLAKIYETEIQDIQNNKNEDSKTPIISPIRLLQNIADVTSSFCPKDDAYCVSLANQQTILATQDLERISEGGGFSFYTDIEYPSDFSPKIKSHMDKIFNTIQKIPDHESIEHTLGLLSDIKDDLLSMDLEEEVDNNGHRSLEMMDKYHSLGVACASVAIESTRLWHEVLSNENHPLHLLGSNTKLTSTTSVAQTQQDPHARQRSLQTDRYPNKPLNGFVGVLVLTAQMDTWSILKAVTTFFSSMNLWDPTYYIIYSIPYSAITFFNFFSGSASLEFDNPNQTRKNRQ